jgi:hypothetical protein
MAVRIVSPGPGVVELFVSCKGCGSELGYVPNDVGRHDGTDYGGGPDGNTFILCPQCGKKVILTSW